ncbi:MAG: DUF3006 domain-containing protein [Firmicutes bacterium]|nr:DUF3006 domain-containing protein [[Eubacterium] siraeum]MCM1487235.1 DUF3006 domain-containing protein [Bacillota bacterium]
MLIIDRLEGDFAVVEDSESGKMTNIHKDFIEENAKEGDVIVPFDTFYVIDRTAAKKRREEILALKKSISQNHK